MDEYSDNTGQRCKLFLITTVAETHWYFLRGQVQYLQKQGIDVTLVSSPGKWLEACRTRDGVHCIPVTMTRRMNPLKDCLSLLRLWWLFLRERPDIVQYSTPKGALLGSVASTLAGIRCRIFLIRGSISGAQRGWSTVLNRSAEWLTVRLSREVICVSHSLRSFLRKEGVLKKNEGIVIENGMSNGINIDYFQQSGEGKGADSSLQKSKIVGFVGRLNREKGIEDFAKAWNTIREVCKESRALLVGRWDTEARVSPETRRALENDPRVEIVGHVEDIRPFLHRMNVLCFPSYREGFPNAPMEAAATGIPVVAFNSVGSTDAVEDEITGALVPLGNTKALAEAVQAYLEDDSLAKAHGHKGRARVETCFQQEPIWRGILGSYRDAFHKTKLSEKESLVAYFKSFLLKLKKAVTWILNAFKKIVFGNHQNGKSLLTQQVSLSRGRTTGAVTIIGAGGHAKVVISCIRECGMDPVRIYDDDESLWGSAVSGVPVVGGVEDFQSEFRNGQRAVVAIGDNHTRRRLTDQLFKMSVDWATIVHPYSFVEKSAVIGAGSVVCAGAVVQAGAVVGEHVIVNTSATIDHDCQVKSYCHLAPHATLAGDCIVKEEALIGAGSTVLPMRIVGRKAVVGAGATVTRDVTDVTTVVGCPAKPMSGLVEDVTTRQCAPWPVFDDEQIEAVAKVLRSGKVNYWTGTEGKTFEQEFADYVGVKHGIAVANGTVALELALAAIGIGAGNDVIVPSRTFIATASSVVMRGGRPVVADIDPVSQNITVETIRSAMTPHTRALIVVHVGGWPCEMDAILNFAREHGLAVIEDCAQAHGAKIGDKSVGSFGDVAAFSFCQDKILTTAGEGGMVVTNDTNLWKKAWSQKDHGKDWDLLNDEKGEGHYRFLHRSFGTNWRMTEAQAAVGRIQLSRLEKWNFERRANAQLLRVGLDNCPAIAIPECPAPLRHAYYRLYGSVQLDQLSAGWTRDRIITRIRELGGNVGCGSCGEIYREEAFADIWSGSRLPVASVAHETSLAFVVHPGLTSEWLKHLVAITLSTFHEATTGTCKDVKRAA